MLFPIPEISSSVIYTIFQDSQSQVIFSRNYFGCVTELCDNDASGSHLSFLPNERDFTNN